MFDVETSTWLRFDHYYCYFIMIIIIIIGGCDGGVWFSQLQRGGDVADQETAPVTDIDWHPCAACANQRLSVSAAELWVQEPPGQLQLSLLIAEIKDNSQITCLLGSFVC